MNDEGIIYLFRWFILAIAAIGFLGVILNTCDAESKVVGQIIEAR